ncbi:MAG TPA: IS21 family transposase, partial [Coriobacteriia bacterium]
MLDQSQRTTVLELHRQGQGIRAIARVLQISRGAVRDVLAAGTATVPTIARPEKADPYVDDIRQLYVSCQGNLVRVHEELRAGGAGFSYQALTGFCRRHGIGTDPITPAGAYHFDPGVEMQHDTSPHRVTIGGQVRLLQTASLVLCYSRLIYIQLYPRFTRFWCKVFLTDALQYVGGAARACMIDNTHVVVLQGTGAEMVPVPEMAAFADRFGFLFRAHEKGDANRSARVERPFDFVEHNFLAGRTFTDGADLNRQALAWCDRVNATFTRHLHASRRDLFAVERPHLTPLPVWIPAVYQLHHRIVDTAGYVHVDRTSY